MYNYIMKYSDLYVSPAGIIEIKADDDGITELSFIKEYEKIESTAFNKHINDAKNWLDIYFSGKIPKFTPSLKLNGTDFQKKVWRILMNIPYGNTVAYKIIASEIAREYDIHIMSAQAVGSAVAKNPVLIIVPCHRVIGSNGKLTGYSAGINIKTKLLKLEEQTIKKEIAVYPSPQY